MEEKDTLNTDELFDIKSIENQDGVILESEYKLGENEETSIENIKPKRVGLWSRIKKFKSENKKKFYIILFQRFQNNICSI